MLTPGSEFDGNIQTTITTQQQNGLEMEPLVVRLREALP